jgi:hypothetical protein
MRTHHLSLLLALPVGLAPAVGARAASEPAPPTAVSAEAASAQWSHIKDHSHEMRTSFFAGLKKLEAKLDAQIRELTTKRATMKGITGTREWDFAMKELDSARTYLHAVGAELAKASRETWDQEKDKVGRAWTSTQDACAKVKRSTTS